MLFSCCIVSGWWLGTDPGTGKFLVQTESCTRWGFPSLSIGYLLGSPKVLSLVFTVCKTEWWWAFVKRERSPNEKCCMKAWENCRYVLSWSLLLKPIVALVCSLRVFFSFPGSKMKPSLDSPGLLEVSLMHVKLCVFQKVCINEMYISDRSLNFLWAFFCLHFS